MKFVIFSPRTRCLGNILLLTKVRKSEHYRFCLQTAIIPTLAAYIENSSCGVRFLVRSKIFHAESNFSCGVRFFMWSNDKLLHIADMEQFVIAPHDEIAPHDNQLCHVLQNCLSCGTIFIHMTSKITLQ